MNLFEAFFFISAGLLALGLLGILGDMAVYWWRRRRTQPPMSVAFIRPDGARVMAPRCHDCGAHVFDARVHDAYCAARDNA